MNTGVILLIALLPVTAARIQRVVAKGKLFCGDKPAANVKVKLVDKDVVSDDVMDEKMTNAEGQFHLDGKQDEMTNIDPYLKIYHKCDDSWKLCDRRWKIKIPDKYINDPNDSNPKVFDFGTVNLEGRIQEDRNCI